MTRGVPAEDAERVLFSGEHSPPPLGVLGPAIIAGISVIVGVVALSADRRDAPVGVALILLPLLGALLWWRWGTPLSCVVATRTGLLISRGKREVFVPYEAVGSLHRTWLRGGSLIVTVTLREPAAELRRFAFVAAYAPGIQAGIEHPIVTELARRVDTAKRGGSGDW